MQKNAATLLDVAWSLRGSHPRKLQIRSLFFSRMSGAVRWVQRTPKYMGFFKVDIRILI